MERTLTFDKVITFELEDKTYSGEVSATGVEYHEPGCMNLRNGDPGYPPEDEFNITSFGVLTLFDEETNEDLLETYNSDSEFKKSIDDAVHTKLDTAYENNEWDFPYEGDEYDF